MPQRIALGASAVAAVGLLLALPGTSQAHISPSGLDTNTGTPGIQLPANTNLVVCANHAAATLHVVNESNPGSSTPYRADKFTSGQCRAYQLDPGMYRVGGFNSRNVATPPCVNSATDPNYPDCPRPHEWIKVFQPNQEEATWLEESAPVNVPTAPAAPTYGFANSGNVNYPTIGSNNVPVVSVSFAANSDTI